MLNYLNTSATPRLLKKVQASLVYLDRQYIRMRKLERKQDTRRKIQLGGLVKKAGLDEETTAVIYGLLLDARERLMNDDAEDIRRSWKIKGDLALTEERP